MVSFNSAAGILPWQPRPGRTTLDCRMLRKLLTWDRKLLKLDLKHATEASLEKVVLDCVKRAVYDQIARPKGRAHNLGVVLQYAVAAGFIANLPGARTVLELGMGYSTVLLAYLLPRDVAFMSLDGKPWEAYDIAPALGVVRDRVRMLCGPSISRAEYDAAWGEEGRAAFVALGRERLRGLVKSYLRDHDCAFSRDAGLTAAPDFAERCLDILWQPDPVTSVAGRFADVLAADRAYAAKGRSLSDELLVEHPALDAVFFDCGEFSSLGEWFKLGPRIRPGGLAVFHDVYFPKSTKNFLVCALMEASGEWEILYRDATTPQGLVVARRKEASPA